MEEAGSLSGYRYIWHALRLGHHLNLPRRIVPTIMKEIEPDGAKARRPGSQFPLGQISHGTLMVSAQIV